MSSEEMSIRRVPMVCLSCKSRFPLEDCNCDGPIGDGLIGCPVDDYGGEMKEAIND